MPFDDAQFDPSTDEYQKIQDSVDYLAMTDARAEYEAQEWPQRVMYAVETGEANIRQTAETFKDYLGLDYDRYLDAKLQYYREEVARIAEMILGTTIWYDEDRLQARLEYGGFGHTPEEDDYKDVGYERPPPKLARLDSNGDPLPVDDPDAALSDNEYFAKEDWERISLDGDEIIEAIIKDILDETLEFHADVDELEDNFSQAVEKEPSKIFENMSAYKAQPFGDELIRRAIMEHPLIALEYIDYVEGDPELYDFIFTIFYEVFNAGRDKYSSEQRGYVAAAILENDPDELFNYIDDFRKEEWFTGLVLKTLPLMNDPWNGVASNLKYIGKIEGIQDVLTEVSKRSESYVLVQKYEEFIKYFPQYLVCIWIANAIEASMHGKRYVYIPKLADDIASISARKQIYQHLTIRNGEVMLMHFISWIDEPFSDEIIEKLSVYELVKNNYTARRHPKFKKPLHDAYIEVAKNVPGVVLDSMNGIEDLTHANEVFGAMNNENFGKVVRHFYAWYTGYTHGYARDTLKNEETLKGLDEVKADWFPEDLRFSDKATFAIIVCRNINSHGGEISKESVKAEYEAIIKGRESIGSTPIFEGRNVVLASHLEKWDSDYDYKDRFGLKTLQDRIKVLQGGGECTFDHFEPKSRTATALEKAKSDTLKAIGSMPSPLTFIFDGHGSRDGIFYSDGQIIEDRYREKDNGRGSGDVVKTELTRYIDVDEFTAALKERYLKVGVAMKNDIFIIDTCYSYDFSYSVRAKLIAANVPVPIFISSSEKDQSSSSTPENEYGDDLYDVVLGIKEDRPVLSNIWENEHLGEDHGTTIFLGGEGPSKPRQLGYNETDGYLQIKNTG